MTKYAFVDQVDGYYEADVSGGQLPEWTKSLISCPVRPANIPQPPTPLQQIRALEQANDDDQRKLNRQAAIDTALTVVCRSPAAAGKTRAEVHALWYAANRGYRAMVDLEAAVEVLRKQIV